MLNFGGVSTCDFYKLSIFLTKSNHVFFAISLPVTSVRRHLFLTAPLWKFRCPSVSIWVARARRGSRIWSSRLWVFVVSPLSHCWRCYTPENSHGTPKLGVWADAIPFSIGAFSVSMLVFGGVIPMAMPIRLLYLPATTYMFISVEIADRKKLQGASTCVAFWLELLVLGLDYIDYPTINAIL